LTRSVRVVADDLAGRREAADVLVAGGVVAIPTDTVYGIAVAATTAGGVDRLFAIKERPPDKGIVLLLDDLEQVAPLVRATPAADALRSLWPGGLTLVLPGAGEGTIAVRIPDHAVPRTLAQVVGPLPTTSANLSGAPEARSAADVVSALGDRVDLVVDGGPNPGGVASTVVDCSTEPVRILRQGSIPADVIATRLRAAGLPGPSGAG
jgi:L-threonylcarbamoyladenylate synthase